MEVKTVNNSITAVYAGGGKWLTQAAPTNFHGFWEVKALAKGEKPEDFREVSADERAALEASDAAWSRPPQAFIDRWNEKCRWYYSGWTTTGKYNEETGFFECNGLKDITYTQAIMIDNASLPNASVNNNQYTRCQARTVFHPNGVYHPVISNMFEYATGVEVVNLEIQAGNSCFLGCSNLRRISLYAPNAGTGTNIYKGCTKLEDINFAIIQAVSFSLEDSPLINFATLNRLCTKKTNTTAITITVHPDVMAKIEDESNEEWHALLELGAAKNIQWAC